MEFNCTIEQLLEFKILFPTEESPNIQKVLSNFSRQQLLNMIVVLGNRYANKSFLEITDFFSDPNYYYEIHARIQTFYPQDQRKYILVSFQVLMELLRYALTIPIEGKEIQDSPQKEYELFKVITYLNQLQSAYQKTPSKLAPLLFISFFLSYTSNVSKEMLKMRIQLQLFSAYHLFKFIEEKSQQDSQLSQLYNHFLSKYGIKSGFEYIRTLFGIIAVSNYELGRIPKDLKIDEDKLLVNSVLDTISLSYDIQFKDIHDVQLQDYRLFRSKPLFRDLGGNYMVYSMEFLIDKLFNSLYFEFIELNKQYNCHVNVSDFFTYQFSELKLFNLLIQQSNPGQLYNEINNSTDETGLTDYILYNDNHTLLFECKDIKINGALIETHDYSVIIDEYKNKLYEKTFKYQNGEKVMLSSPKPIGIGQLVENINNIRQGKYGDHNLPITGIIYPVLVLSDYKILPIGFPYIANDWYCQGLESHNLRENNKPLIIMSFITLIVYSNRFQEDGFDYYFEEYYKYIDSIDRTQPEHYISFDMFMERYAFDLKDFYTLLMSEFHQI